MLYPVKVSKIQFVFQDKTFTYYEDMHWAYIHGNLMCIVLAYYMTTTTTTTVTVAMKEVDIACASLYICQRISAQGNVELNKNKYKIEDTAAKVEADNATKERSVLSLQSSLQNICSTI